MSPPLVVFTNLRRESSNSPSNLEGVMTDDITEVSSLSLQLRRESCIYSLLLSGLVPRQKEGRGVTSLHSDLHHTP